MSRPASGLIHGKLIQSSSAGMSLFAFPVIQTKICKFRDNGALGIEFGLQTRVLPGFLGLCGQFRFCVKTLALLPCPLYILPTHRQMMKSRIRHQQNELRLQA